MVPIRQTSSKRIREFLLPESTPVPNRLFEILHLLTPSEVLVFLFIWRKTVGWQKASDYISLSQIQKGTGVGRRQALAASQLFADAGVYIRSRKGARGMALIELHVERIAEAFERLLALVSNRNQNQCQKDTSTGVAESIVPVSERILTGVKGTHTETNSVQSDSLESKRRKEAASVASDFGNPKTDETAPPGTTVKTIDEMQTLYRWRWRRGFSVPAKTQPELVELVLEHGSARVLAAFELFLADNFDEFLVANKHPIASFVRRFKVYLVTEESKRSTGPAEPMVEHEGKMIPAWLREEKIKEAAAAEEKKRSREQKEKEAALEASFAESSEL